MRSGPLVEGDSLLLFGLRGHLFRSDDAGESWEELETGTVAMLTDGLVLADGTILNTRKGIPIVTCGPGNIHIPHHIDEWVSFDEIKVAARMYVLAAMRFLGVEDWRNVTQSVSAAKDLDWRLERAPMGR